MFLSDKTICLLASYLIVTIIILIDRIFYLEVVMLQEKGSCLTFIHSEVKQIATGEGVIQDRRIVEFQ